MSVVIRWATPDFLGGIEIDVRKVIVEKRTPPVTVFTELVVIDATNDGEPKSDSNEYVNAFEDPVGTDVDIYRLKFKDAAGNISQPSAEGNGGFLSPFHDILDRCRKRLGDNDPLFYQLDQTPQLRWDSTVLGTSLRDSLDEFNGMGPMVTNFSFEVIIPTVIPILIHGTMSFALSERGIKEIANVLRYNDGVSFDITNRPADYRAMAKDEWDKFERLTRIWKLANRPRAIGLGSQRLPFRVTRPLGLLPNMRNVFGF